MTEAEWLSCADPRAMLRFVTQNPDHQDIVCCRSDRKLRLFACACCRQVWDRVVCGKCHGAKRVHVADEEMLSATHRRGEYPFTPPQKWAVCPACGGSGRVGGLTDPRSCRAVEAAEQYADNLILRGNMESAHHEARAAWEERDNLAGLACYASTAVDLADAVRRITQEHLTDLPPPATQAALLLCIVGSPFRKPSCGWDKESVWRGDWLINAAVLGLARQIYDERAFDLLPVLGDALEDAGCADEDILWHCRGKRRCPNCLGRGSKHKSVSGPMPSISSTAWGSSTVVVECFNCDSKGWLKTDAPHACGCWVLDLLLGKE